jgi:hypothetical protein
LAKSANCNIGTSPYFVLPAEERATKKNDVVMGDAVTMVMSMRSARLATGVVRVSLTNLVVIVL